MPKEAARIIKKRILESALTCGARSGMNFKGKLQNVIRAGGNGCQKFTNSKLSKLDNE